MNLKYPIVNGKKECGQCHEFKTLDNFSRSRNHCSSYCKKCVNENGKIYYSLPENKQRMQEYSQKYANIPENKKRIKKRLKEWQNKNKDKSHKYSKKWNDTHKTKRTEIVNFWKSRNPDKVKSYNKKSGAKWAANNKGKRNAIDMRRKAGLIQRTPKWADLDKIREFYVEAERLTKETGIPHEVDHIIPLQGKNISGLHVHNNLQILTKSKNRSKKNNYDVVTLFTECTYNYNKPI